MAVSGTPPAKLLLVEGPDDKHVVQHLCRRLASDLTFQCEDKGGSGPLLDAIDVEIATDERIALGIVVDANDDLAARWQAIGNRLDRTNVQLPSQPEHGGTIVDSEPRVGVWLMPNNATPGELENFVAELVPKDDPIWPLAEQYIEGIPSEHRPFSPNKQLRAKIHAWLATRREPRRMGAAIGTAELDAETPLASQFADWLRALFGPVPHARQEGSR